MNQQGATVGARLEKVLQWWRRVKPYLTWVMRWVKTLLGFALICLLVAGAIWALIYVPRMQVPVCLPGQEGLPPKICFDIENEARRTLAYILAGILAIIGIYMAHRRIRALERQVLVAQEGQITERFTRAIEQLGSKEMAIRLGGIYALERIANDSDKDYWPIMETLTAYVRERAPWREPPSEAPAEAVGEETITPAAATSQAPAARPKPATDIQAILTVLNRRKYCFGQGENQRLDLRRTDLRGAGLMNAHLEFVNLRGAHLEEAFLSGAHVEFGDLREANFEDAVLVAAHLEFADLSDARFECSDIELAHLEGAYLRGAMGLDREQIDGAIIDDKTKLPDYLQEEPPKAKGPEGNNEA